MSQAAGSGGNVGLLWSTAAYPSTPVTFTTGVNATIIYASYEMAGIVVGDGTGKFIGFGPNGNTDVSDRENFIIIQEWSSPTIGAATLWSKDVANAKFFAIEDDGTNLTFLVGADPNAMVQVYQMNRTAFLSNPSKIGLLISNNYASYGVAATFFDSSFGN